MPTPIPGPKGLPILGNAFDIKGEVPILEFERHAEVFKDIYRLKLGKKDLYIASSYELFDELCDETRFYKLALPGLTVEFPADLPKGLFVSQSEKEPDWAQAHRILMPAFGPMSIEGMFDEMYDIATQLAMKWARKEAGSRVLATDDFTRLTLDTIALCAMDYRFNSFYTEGTHPYVEQMNINLEARNNPTDLNKMFKRLTSSSYRAEVAHTWDYLQEVSMDLVERRRKNPTEKKDLLNAMIYGKDPKTGEQMRDSLIAANMQTFLVAGHETTSGLLSFAFMELLLNPATFFAAQKEVDRVCGKEKIQPKHLKDLHYIEAVLRETLRLHPTAPAFGRGVRPENKEHNVYIGKDQYEIPREQSVLCLITRIQRDPKIYGEDAESFRPDRMLDDNFNKLPKNAWKPFGTGVRACIGRAFAWQEALLVMAMILQNFDITLDDPNYKIVYNQTLTIKPKNCWMKVKLRDGLTATSLQARLNGQTHTETSEKTTPIKAMTTNHQELLPMTILYGSNTGTCQALAQKLAAEAGDQGFCPTVKEMDDGVGLSMEEDGTLIVITASYEGEPPDNANRFVAWLKTLHRDDDLKGLNYAVFGCGHKDWASTYQKIPTLVDNMLNAHGAKRIVERGVSDASQRDMGGDFDSWMAESLWPVLACSSPTRREPVTTKPKLPSVEFNFSQEQREEHLQQKSQWAEVTSTRILTAPGVGEKRHIEFKLPEDLTYRTGDYLSVLPLNPEESIRRVFQRFKLPADSIITISKGGATTLPTGQPISVHALLRGYVELSQPITKKELELLMETVSIEEKQKLGEIANGPGFAVHVLERRASILDILERVAPSSNIAFASFLALLPPLRPRHYSISSSPLVDPSSVSLTYSVLDAPTWADDTKRFVGVAGGYLRSLEEGDRALVSVRPSNMYFRTPIDPENTPLIMLCAGSGLAPFRGFLQERAVMINSGGRQLAPALLFIGCRSSVDDRLYADEIDKWVREGIVDVRYAFSREPEHELAQGCQRVQNRLWKDQEDLIDLFKRGAKVYTCGSGDLLRELKTVAKEIVLGLGAARGEDWGDEEIDTWFEKHHNDRFVNDVFS